MYPYACNTDTNSIIRSIVKPKKHHSCNARGCEDENIHMDALSVDRGIITDYRKVGIKIIAIHLTGKYIWIIIA